MILNKKKIESSIFKDEEIWLYKVELPWIERYFESVIFSVDWIKKNYWEKYKVFEHIDLWNNLIWISRFNNYYIFCFIDLNNLNSKYYFVESFDITEVSLNRENYSVFVYKDFQNELWYFIDYNWVDFDFKVENNHFIVKNNIFWNKVLSKKINLENNLKWWELRVLKSDDKQYLDIADFFIYDDFFIKSNEQNFIDFSSFLENLENKAIKVNTNLKYKINITNYNDLYYPKLKINLSILSKDIVEFELKDFRKLLLAFFGENIFCYLINNELIEKYFSNYFNDFTNIEFNKLDLDFSLPEDIFTSDKAFKDFKIEFLKFRYNLFLLKEAYNLKDIKTKWSSLYIKQLNNRLEINKTTLEKTIFNYENMLSKLLQKLGSMI